MKCQSFNKTHHELRIAVLLPNLLLLVIFSSEIYNNKGFDPLLLLLLY